MDTGAGQGIRPMNWELDAGDKDDAQTVNKQGILSALSASGRAQPSSTGTHPLKTRRLTTPCGAYKGAVRYRLNGRTSSLGGSRRCRLTNSGLETWELRRRAAAASHWREIGTADWARNRSQPSQFSGVGMVEREPGRAGQKRSRHDASNRLCTSSLMIENRSKMFFGADHGLEGGRERARARDDGDLLGLGGGQKRH